MDLKSFGIRLKLKLTPSDIMIESFIRFGKSLLLTLFEEKTSKTEEVRTEPNDKYAQII